MGFFDKPEVVGPGGDGRGDTARLAELERRVAQLEAQVAQLTRPGSAFAPDPSWLTDVRALAARGKKIEAIKVYRERTGVTLKEAKDAVDAMPD